MRVQSGWKIYLVLLLLDFAVLGCNLPLAGGVDSTGIEKSDETDEKILEGGEGRGPQNEVVATAEGMDLAPCPVKEGAMILKFSAVITINSGEARMTHTLEDGILNLWTEDGPGPVYQVRSLEPAPIPYKISGTMGECTLTGEGSMTPDAYGTCEAGVVQLTIVENWGEAKGTVTCSDQRQDFPMPGIGRLEHTGADGKGELFFLDRGFSEAGAGMTSIRPFGMGDGEHIWTIYVDPWFIKP